MVSKELHPYDYLEQALQSILNQTYEHLELVEFKDSSNDAKVAEIIYDFERKDKRIVFIDRKENIGISLSRNECFGFTKGEYIAVMDHDDISHPEGIERQFMYINEINWIYAVQTLTP